jgi:maltodextrin utilization protein YvdJ
LGEGSYGTVFLAVDTKPQGIKRKLENKYLNLLDKVELNPSGGSVYTRNDEDVVMTEEQKSAVSTLGNKQLIFDKNEMFEQTENS